MNKDPVSSSREENDSKAREGRCGTRALHYPPSIDTPKNEFIIFQQYAMVITVQIFVIKKLSIV